MNDAANAVSRMPLPRASWDRPTRFGIEARYPARKNPRRIASGAVTRRITAIVGPWTRALSGTSAVKIARPRSATNIIRLRSPRSAKAPAMVPMKKSAPASIAPTIPMASPEPVSARTRSGMAVEFTASPAAETVWLTSSVEKSRFRRSGSSVGTVGLSFTPRGYPGRWSRRSSGGLTCGV